MHATSTSTAPPHTHIHTINTPEHCLSPVLVRSPDSPRKWNIHCRLKNHLIEWLRNRLALRVSRSQPQMTVHMIKESRQDAPPQFNTLWGLISVRQICPLESKSRFFIPRIGCFVYIIKFAAEQMEWQKPTCLRLKNVHNNLHWMFTRR